MTVSPRAPRTEDFPDWIGPILVKELRQGLKTRAFVLSFVGLQIVFVITLIFNAVLYAQKGKEFDPDSLHNIFWMLVGLQLVVITPLRSLNEIAGERKAGTLELIYMTSLTSWRIVFGKWVSLLFQNLLFLAAVLPYGILRYYFGSVNLLEDLTVLGYLLLASAVLSALAMAASGMPLAVRIGAIVIGLFLAPSLSFGIAMGLRSAGAISAMGDLPWLLIVWNAAVLIAYALDIGAQTIAPPAENHAGRQRVITLTVLLPVPLLMLLRVDKDQIFSQVVLFSILSFFTAFHQTASFWSPIRPHLAPYARLGKLGFILAAFLLPGAASASLYLVVSIAVIFGLAIHLGMAFHDPSDWEAPVRLLLAGAALLTAPVIYKAMRRFSRTAIAEYVAFLTLSGVAASFIHLLGGDHPFDLPWLAAFPPVGFWMAQGRPESGRYVWEFAAFLAFAGYWLVLQFLSLPYWRYALALFRDIRRNQQSSSSAVLPAVASA